MWLLPEIRMRVMPSPLVTGRYVVLETLLRLEQRTNIEEVTVRLRGHETFAVEPGQEQQERRVFLDQRARFTPLVLGPAEHRLRSVFALPAEEMGSYEGKCVAVIYQATVKARIPWWFDASEDFVLPVQARVRPPAAPRPVIFASRVEGPIAGETYAELSLERNVVEAGGVLQGALSMTAASPRTRQVTLSLELHEVSHLPPDLHWSYGTRVDHGVSQSFKVVLYEGAPADGVAMAFRMRLPPGLVPTARGRVVQLQWRLVVQTKVAVGFDFVWSVPLEIEPGESGAGSRPPALEPMPLVGHERRAQIWRQAAERLKLATESGRERMTGEEGRARFVVRLEASAQGERVAVARVEWPALEGEFELRERRWSDALGGSVRALDDGPFDARFAVRAERGEVIEALLGPETRRHLLGLAEVYLDKHGARLVSPVDVRSIDSLVASLEPLTTAARALGAGRDTLPVAEQFTLPVMAPAPARRAAEADRGRQRGGDPRSDPRRSAGESVHPFMVGRRGRARRSRGRRRSCRRRTSGDRRR